MKLGRFILWRAAAISAVVDIDSGGGSAAVGGMTHHASLGSYFAIGSDLLAVEKNKSGLPAQKLH
jgi:hypothetical protein